jgi:uncharacterized protein (DUF983 family)
MTRTTGNSMLTGIRRGLARRCPNCGEGRLFRGYLKVEATCKVCGHDNGAYRADDGPAYFTILLAGHLLITPLAAFPIVWTWNPMITAAVAIPSTAATALALLAYVKGAFIGMQWALRPAIA